MISNEERREVAWRLRANADLCPNVLFDLHEAVGDATYTQGGLAKRLADLIEPRHETTEDVSDDYGKFECGKCGCRIDDVTAVDNGGINFCPDCGKEVIPHAERRD